MWHTAWESLNYTHTTGNITCSLQKDIALMDRAEGISYNCIELLAAECAHQCKWAIQRLY